MPPGVTTGGPPPGGSSIPPGGAMPGSEQGDSCVVEVKAEAEFQVRRPCFVFVSGREN
jgi:hypothetical protein